jgi:uncharacterized membrane protein
MGKGRIEAFSDAVLAIIITIMVLEFKSPHDAALGALRPLLPVFLSYLLSFIYLGIYWNNHHYLLYVTHRVSAAILWANLHLLFWLSLVPFATRWMGENHFAAAPMALYGLILLLAGTAYLFLQHAILAQEGADSLLAAAIGRDWKGKVSVLMYGVAIPVAFLRPWIAGTFYVVAALMWLVPDRRIERAVSLARPAPLAGTQGRAAG